LRGEEDVDGVTITRDVELALLVEELGQIERRQIAGRVIEEHVLAAIVHDQTGRHEVMRVRLGQIVDRLFSEEGEAADVIDQRICIRRYVGVQCGQGLDFGAPRQKSDLLLEHHARGLADAQTVHLLHRVLFASAFAIRQKGHRLTCRAPVTIELRLYAEAKQHELGLLK
jgi:hypothetical protein